MKGGTNMHVILTQEQLTSLRNAMVNLAKSPNPLERVLAYTELVAVEAEIRRRKEATAQ